MTMGTGTGRGGEGGVKFDVGEFVCLSVSQWVSNMCDKSQCGASEPDIWWRC